MTDFFVNRGVFSGSTRAFRKFLGPASKEMLKNSMTNWSKALRGIISFALTLTGLEEDSHQIVFNNDGLINEFASLKTNKDIEEFSKKYGLLGIKAPDTEQVNSQHPLVKATLQPSFIFNGYGFSVFEPLDLWFWHINEVRQILKLYNTLRKDSSEERVNQIIEIKMAKGRFGSLAEDRRITERFFIHWTKGGQLLILPKSLKTRQC
ncbi:hypothetical protein [Peribacillus simplex]|uniref:Uncharacterized protein n=1 Tax=Peribacillus simplex TaxID=1478 RepID=A0AAW7IAI1_9BACI|nr:hypothetical protein [Peribacillus simplex]MDM5450877.1 hypothetical protein [Peribacillus simplex]